MVTHRGALLNYSEADDDAANKIAQAAGVTSVSAAAIGPDVGAWVYGSLTCTNADQVYVATVSTPIAAPYLVILAQASETDSTPVKVVVRINAAPTASTGTNIDGVGILASGLMMTPLDGTTVTTVQVMSASAGADVSFGLANPGIF